MKLMKIFYAVQATGNGHISRAHQLYPYLRALGEVDFLLSGSNSTLACNFPVKYRSKGLSLFYDTCGDLHYRNTLKGARIFSAFKDAKDLPLEQYDLIINDFDFITAQACRIKKLKSVQFGHQASFQSKFTPRPDKKNLVGEMILKHYATASHYVGLHFKSYDDFIFSPVIKESIQNASPSDNGHITVYLPAYEQHCIESILKEISPVEVHWFLPHIKQVHKKDNITFFPIDQEHFNHSLIHCSGILTGGGFETPAEALYLQKKLLSIPIGGQYEQQCNAAALKELGIPVMKELNQNNKEQFFEWIHTQQAKVKLEANDIPETLNFMLNKMHSTSLAS